MNTRPRRRLAVRRDWLAALLALMGVASYVLCPRAHADQNYGPYVGAGAGEYNLRIDNATTLGQAIDGYHEHDTAYQLFAGWRFLPFLSLEGQYMNLGTNRGYAGATEVTNKIYGWAPWVVGTLPLGPTAPVVGPIELFAKAGEYWYNYHTDIITPLGQYESTSNTYNHFVWGGGIGVVVAQRIPVRLEYDVLNIQNTNTSNALWLTAAFRF
jgi:opacity protein-like surface antigen